MAILKARPQDVEIDLSRIAFIVVAMQNAYAKKGGMLDPGASLVEPHENRRRVRDS